jgi:hypothetical protein
LSSGDDTVENGYPIRKLVPRYFHWLTSLRISADEYWKFYSKVFGGSEPAQALIGRVGQPDTAGTVGVFLRLEEGTVPKSIDSPRLTTAEEKY